MRVTVLVLCVGLCLLRNTWSEQEEEEEGDLAWQEVARAPGHRIASGRLEVSIDLVGDLWGKRLCCASLSSLPVSVLTKPAPIGLLLRAFMIILWVIGNGILVVKSRVQATAKQARAKTCISLYRNLPQRKLSFKAASVGAPVQGACKKQAI
eukprot:1136856-Pelagomonas_calceolata.AAC.1